MGTLQFDSEDLGRTEDFLSRTYTKMRIGGTADCTRAQVSRDSVGSTSIDRLAFDYDMSHDATLPIGKICLGNVHSGTIVRQHAGGTEGSFGPGDVFLYAPHDRPYAGVIQRARYNLILLDPALLDQVATPLPGPEHVRLTGDRPVSRDAGRNLRRTIAYLRDHVFAEPELRDAPLLASTATQMLAASVLYAFPNNAITDATTEDRRDARPATLRRAIAFIEDRADSQISAADIAAAARVSQRALQYAFRHHLGTTPLGYLRQVRLAQAHRDLMAADYGTGVTVTGIAARWGFLHPGRFAADYRRAYGRSPRQSLFQSFPDQQG
ncbi:helix-turn-helix transcriptional regulator [Streptomyces atriruber]|uniref:Helix-turn-helix transcriptional regulator n=1 Tax=Streptomyces atriruber TaxID=545121 RepID=A0ABV3BIL4_9ACTN